MNQQAPISMAVRLTLSDIVPVVFRNSLRQIRWGIALLGVLILGAAVHTYLFGVSHPAAERTSVVSLLLGLLAIALSLPVSLLLGSYFTARSALKNNPNFHGDFQYSFSDEGIQVQGIHSTGSLSWNGLNHVVETRNAFLLFHDKYNAQAVPKRCFANDSDVAALRALIQAHAPRARLRTS
jgi:hypothetical protein